MTAETLRQYRKWMIDLRKKRALSQSAVAQALGISQPYYAAIETGRRVGTGDIGLRITRFYGVPLEWFYVQSSPRVANPDSDDVSTPVPAASDS